MSSYTNTANNDVSSLANAMSSISSDKTAIVNAQSSLVQNKASLSDLLSGADSLDIQSSQLGIEQQKLSLQTAQQNYDNDYIRAPIDGVISSIPAIIGQSPTSPVVTLVGNGQVAAITLNEVDAAKVKVGNKATLTFDAITGLTLAGTVVQLDPVGTVSQGVVNYNAQIALATPSDQVKPGMSVSATIVTQAHQDVIAVPNAAIVKQGGASYILKPVSPLTDDEIATVALGGIELQAAPNRIPITVGLTSNTMTEITSGVTVGDQIIVRTISGVAKAPAATGNTSALGALGGGALGGGGGNVRVISGGAAPAGR